MAARAQTDDQLLLSVSTNLHQLAHDPVRVLIASAFWTGGWWELAVWTALFAAILAPVEHRLGWRRTTLTFAAGHIGATLIVATGLWIGIQLGADPADVLAHDVGASYGFFAVASLAAYLLAPRYRTRYPPRSSATWSPQPRSSTPSPTSDTSPPSRSVSPATRSSAAHNGVPGRRDPRQLHH